MVNLVTGLLIGIVGSLHCIGMCGPLALALPIHQFDNTTKGIVIALYNIGRVISYTVIGALFGMLGQGFSMFNLQQALSIGAGIFILLVLFVFSSKAKQIPLLEKFSTWVRMELSRILNSQKSVYSYFTFGLLNGLLPCGLVYLALTASIASGTILSGSLVMIGFGLGTIPAMALSMYAGKFISTKARLSLQSFTPYFVAVVACLLIVRGMNLGIPYVSPKSDNKEVSCCKRR